MEIEMPITQHPSFQKSPHNTKLNFVAVYINKRGRKVCSGLKPTFDVAARIAEKTGGEVFAAYTA